MKFTKSILLTAAAVVMPLVANAAAITSNPTLNVGSMMFNNFSCTVTLAGSLAQPNSCSSVDVSAINATPGGVEFSSGFSAALGSFDDVKLQYSLTTNPGTAVNAVNLFFDGSIFGNAIASVTESVWSNGNYLGKVVVNCSTVSCSNGVATLNLGGYYSNLTIQKDINVTAGQAGQAQTSIIDQTFTPVASPEPASTALMGAGLTLAAFFMRRKLSNNN